MMTREQAVKLIYEAGGRLVQNAYAQPREHRGRTYVCGGELYQMPRSKCLVVVYSTPARNGWELGPDSLIEENMQMNAAAVADALDKEKVAKVLEFCP